MLFKILNAVVLVLRALQIVTTYEEPAYDVLLESSSFFNSFEVRKYSVRVAIETENDSDNDAFMRLASYIGVGGEPQNEANETISMTTPVAIDMTVPVINSDDGKMMFILPSEYESVEMAPTPLNDDVWLTELPESEGAVRRYIGAFGDRTKEWVSNAFIEELNSVLTTKLEGEFKVEFWVFGFLRQEIYIELSPDQVNELKDEYARKMLRF